jgi:hydroxymethylglutaryl-CoA reductase (NADPH)
VVSVTMPSIEVGTIGGGANLKPQASVLDLLGVRGSSSQTPGHNSQRLAKVVCAAVLAGELGLCSVLSSDDLVRSHLELNRRRPQKLEGTQGWQNMPGVKLGGYCAAVCLRGT